jgi:hypothetical protein
MPNPTLNQITRNAVLLKDKYTAVTECMSRPDRYFNPPADRLQNMSVDVIHDQGCSVLRLRGPANLTIANMLPDESHNSRIHIDFSVPGFTFGVTSWDL